MLIINKYNFAFFFPTFNEEKNIENVITEIRKVFDGYIFLVDGYSTDNTLSIAKNLNVETFRRNSSGKGSAIQKALEIAHEKKIDFLMFYDCDQTYNPNDIEKFITLAPNNDLIIGVRPLKLIKPFSRRLGNIVATGLINIGLDGNIKDSISGFKCLRVEKFHNQIHENGFVADALICVVALRDKLKIQHIEIDYKERDGKSKMNLKIGLIEFVKLIKHIIKIIVKTKSHKAIN